MSNFLIIIVTIIYFYVSVEMLIQHKHGLSVMFLAYAVANIGIILTNKGL